MTGELSHREWPLPDTPWAMRMVWEDLLFMHWPVPANLLRVLVPEPLEIDTFEGEAWVGVVPFRMSGIGLRGLPALPGASAFPELNVRTYVRYRGKPGVWFFSLDAGHLPAVHAARHLFNLPYFSARMEVGSHGGEIDYTSTRTHRGADPAEFAASYRPTGQDGATRSGDLDHWLTARYCLYSMNAHGTLYRGEIEHDPWPLQPAEAELRSSTMTDWLGIRLPDTAPLLHFAGNLGVRAWAIRPIAAAV